MPSGPNIWVSEKHDEFERREHYVRHVGTCPSPEYASSCSEHEVSCSRSAQTCELN